MNTDPIADLLTRIRNASKAHHEKAIIPYSKAKEGIVKVMKDKGFIEDYKVKEEKNLRTLEIKLIEERSDMTLKRISSPGQRIYVKNNDIKEIKSGLGISIISTSKGIMTNSEAKKQNIGGEIICEIY
ncbi:30S ribosomal protein S8 [Candidatus Peregrinibacteria bacterium]|nr:30S ribosomal protein S8 [Candidatus Peregrinibacteria bacterium]